MRHTLMAGLFVLFLVGSQPTPSFAVSIVLPPTGQTTCQDMDGLPIPCAGTGQDGELRKGVVLAGPRFTDNGDETITDNLTTLVWARDANLLLTRDPSFDTDGPGPEPDGLISTTTALAYIDKLNTENFGGHNDWRLPNRNELMSLIDTEQANPALPNGHPFINVQNTVYGTNSAAKERPGTFTWLVNMKSGTVGTGYSDITFPLNFWPVRSGSWSGPGGKAYLPATNQKICYSGSTPVSCTTTSGMDGNLQKGVVWPEPRFSDLGDGSVRDTLTNLVWTASTDTPGPAACNPGVNRTWQEAFTYIACLNTNAYLGAGNWRMPNRNELSSLSYIEGTFPPANHPFDVNNNYSLFHSSTPVAANSSTAGNFEETTAWTVRMDGWVSMQGKANHYPVWPVRDFQIALPATGQTTVYATGDDGSTHRGISIPGARFTNTGNETIIDNLTTLVWARTVNSDGPPACSPSTPKSHSEAYDFIACLNSEVFSGYSDWRLPNRNELMSLVDSGQANPALPSGHPFLDMPAGGDIFWTGSRGDISGYGWYVDFTNGTTGVEVNFGSHFVWPVRGGSWDGLSSKAYVPATGQTTPDGTGSDGDLRLGVAWPAPRFTANANGTVTDNLTSLAWSQDANTPDRICNLDTTLTWTDALAHIACLNTNNYLGFSDWRLPNRREMASIIDMERRSPALPAGHPFNDVQNNFSYWSSTTAAADTTKAIVIGMGMGNESLRDKSEMLPVWPVRGGFAPADITPPVIESFTIPAFSRTLTVVVTTFTATDDVGVVDYCMRSIDDPSGCLWSSTPPTDYTFPTVGSKTLYAFARDAAGNISATVSGTVFIDIMLPWVTSFTVPAISNSYDVPISTLIAADDDQIAGYFINETGNTPALDEPGWSVTAPATYTVTGSGGFDLYAFVKDRAGNISLFEETGWAPVLVDISPPQITLFSMPKYYGSETLTVPITLDYIDDVGAQSYCFTETNNAATCNWQSVTGVYSHSFASEGSKTLYAFLRDYAGAVSAFAVNTTTVSYFLPIAIPRTGKTIRYTSGDDGALMAGKAWPMVRFVDNNDGTVTDSLTTLVWSQSANTPTTTGCDTSARKNWVDSLNHIACLNANNYLGFSDWRLPNINELTSLLNFDRADLSVNPGSILDIHPDQVTFMDLVPEAPFYVTQRWGYWSSTAQANNVGDPQNYAYALSADTELVIISAELDVWPVRSGQAFDQQGQAYVPNTGKIFSVYPGDDGSVRSGVLLPTKENRFTVNGNGTTTDRFTNLTWTTNASPAINGLPICNEAISPMTWSQAIDFVACLNRNNYLGFSDWRLPNVRELDSVAITPGDPPGTEVYVGHNMPYFSNVQTTYWSNNTYVNPSPSAWAVRIGYRSPISLMHPNYPLDAGNQFAVWPVRGGIFSDMEKPVITSFTLPLVSQGTFSITNLTATDNMVVTRYCVIEDPNPAMCSMVYPAPTEFTLSGGFGIRTLYAFAIDSRNNISNPVSATILIDSEPPVITLFSLQARGGNLTVPVLFAVDTLTGLADICLTEGTDVSACVWKAELPTSYTFGHNGENTLHAFARDTAGNISDMATAVVTIAIPDTTAPTVTFTLPATSTTAVVPISTFTATDDVAVTGYMLTESATPPLAGSAGWSGAAPANYTFSGLTEGVATPKTLYSWAKDAAGNVSAVTSSAVTITIPDTTAPTVTFALPATSSAPVVSISTFTANDNVAVTGYKLTESATPPTAGSAGWRATAPASYIFSGLTVGTTDKTLYAWAKDAAGNVSTVTSAAVSITIAVQDTLPPTINTFSMVSLSAPLTVPVLSFTASDINGVTGYCLIESSDPAGCSWQETAPANFTFSAYGSTTIYAYARDSFGNIGSISRAITLSDMTPPAVITFTVGNATNSLTVPITAFTATDNGTLNGYCVTEVSDPGSCAWQATAPTSYIISAYGNRSLYAFVRDLAGNVSTPLSDPVSVVDLSLPFVSSFTVSGTAASLTAQVTAFTATDNDRVSGYCIVETNNSAGCTWQATPHTAYTFTTPGPKSLYAFVRDPSGNTGISPQRTLTVGDISPPATPIVTIGAITSATITITSFTSADNVGVTGYCLSEVNSSTGCSWTSTPPAHYSFLNVPEGTSSSRPLFAWARDAFNNISPSRFTFVQFNNLSDTAAPAISAFTLLGSGNSLSVSVTSFAVTDNTAVTGYCVTDSNSPDGCVWQATAPVEYTFATEGDKTLYAFATDAVGNISIGTAASVTVTLHPARIGGAYYPTLQGAYNVAVTSNVIQLKAGSLTNDLLANRDVTVTLDGGAYATSTPNTVIRGVVRISAGKVIANKLAIAP